MAISFLEEIPSHSPPLYNTIVDIVTHPQTFIFGNLFIHIFPTSHPSAFLKSSFEPDLNQRPKDIRLTALQSSALPTELSKVQVGKLIGDLFIHIFPTSQSICTVFLKFSFEPELNQRPKDSSLNPLQSSALPTELSKVQMAK